MQVNEYFDGKVKSIGFENKEGRATVGVMAVGDYEFGTSEHEWIKVISGELTVQLPDDGVFRNFPAGTEFRIGPNQKFQLQVTQPTAYICYYGDAAK
ncbi:MAG: pyrimidine/purine nucleoside phosphorylase [Pirellulaceae bacterium]